MPDDVRLARDYLVANREDYETARAGFRWPTPDRFNFALDWFDPMARGNHTTGLRIARPGGRGDALSFDELSRRSDQVANWLRARGVARGDHLLLMVGNRVELWLSMLAAMKLGAVVLPATTLLAATDVRDRVHRGAVRHVIVESEHVDRFDAVQGDYSRTAVGERVEGWADFADHADAAGGFEPDGPTAADEPLLLYFTSGTTSLPKLVEHSHVSYPVGHLSTMYWLGLRPGDVHLNISSPGWAKHAWSNLFAPWLAEATALVLDYERFDPTDLVEVLHEHAVTSLCAPPTVWRMLIQAATGRRPEALRELVSAGEPLNPEVIRHVRETWGLTIRDGYGQTETTAQIGNPPGQEVRPGSMGRPLPGYLVRLVDPVSGDVIEEPGREGEICLDLSSRPVGLAPGYRDDPGRTAEVMRGGYYHTGDVAVRDEDGYITFVGRTDDVFKSSDYRISPFELESELLTHEAVAEAAVVPSPDPVRLAVPKAYVVLAEGWEPTRQTAAALFSFSRERLAPYKRVRRLEFAALPKTISGKIRRVELRERELRARAGGAEPGEGEWREEDVG